MPISRRRRGRTATRAARSGNLITTNRRKKTNKLYLAVSLLIAVLVIASFAFASFTGGGSSSTTRSGSAQQYVEGVGTQVPLLSRNHVAEGESVVYNSAPPTSGDHWPTPATCGFYDGGLPDERVVHNMEHGNIVVSYNLPLESDIGALRDALDNIGLSRIWGVTRAYDGIPTGQIGLSAWGVLDTFLGVDETRIARFFEAYSGSLGPERFTC